ncbi:hypothetical protein OPV22_014032 [Ensete ventricosum]|uniref:Uncharacterized protein n=1 Tax=Ensete ventricosum TaxID=4639 RepID=A0AAV8R690_ENSVE|nr:hypothetical protein OPV22_014032 [Ensete ventricosum]RWW07146.1 hypothetical protein GW17_00029481 [Ensete ventricosum]RZS08756.1 hypothetical protein BHM03_00039776 [Ensete ventricosum]
MPAHIASPSPRTPWDRSREFLLYASHVATLLLFAFVRWSFEPLVPPLVLEYAAVACLPRLRASPSLLRRSALVSRTTSPPRSPIPSSLSTGVSPDPLGVHRRRFLLLAWERSPVPLLTPTPFRKPIRLQSIMCRQPYLDIERTPLANIPGVQLIAASGEAVTPALVSKHPIAESSLSGAATVAGWLRR